MEQASPCKEAAHALENELKQHKELLPHTITYDGKRVPMTMDRLSREYPNINDTYLLDLIGKFLDNFKNTGDPKISRVSALRHGDKSLLTMLSAFVHHKEVEQCNYLTMTKNQLQKLSLHRLLIAREMGAQVLNKDSVPTALSTFYRERVTISGHRNPVYCVAFDKTNRRLFTGSDDFLVKVWCVRTGYLIHTIRGHQNIITDITINQENTLIATASSDGCVRVWTMDEYKPIMCLRPNATTIKPFTTVKFSPSPRKETRYLMATNEDGIVRLWKWDRDTLQFFDIDSPVTFSCKFRAKDRLRCSSFNYTGTKFTVAGDDGFVYVFSTVRVQTAYEGIISQGGSGHTDDTRPSGRGRKRIASALFPDKSGQVQAQSIVPIGTLEGHMGSVTDLAYSHDGQRILSGSQDGTARIWTFDKETKKWHSTILDIKAPTEANTIVKPTTTNESSISTHVSVLTDDSNEVGSLMPFIEVKNDTVDMDIDTTTTPQPDQAPRHVSTDPAKVSMIAWSSNDRWCFVASNHGEIRVFYACNGELHCVLKGHEGEIYALDNHPLDSGTILSAGYDGNVILWDVEKESVITCRNHAGRTFTDCKFSKDAMKYAITDEEGHCTLFGIGGLDKDYEQVRGWERGQYFMSDYQALRHYADGSFTDDATLQPPYTLQPSLIIDLQGVAYPNQKKPGYGRNIPTTSETFDLEDAKRSACYDLEEEELLTTKLIVLPAVDRASIAKRRREFVRFEDDDEADIAAAATQLQFPPPPILPVLLNDDSADEDYHDEDEPENAAYASSGGSSDEANSDDFIARDADQASEHGGDGQSSEHEGDEEGPVTRSRAGQIIPARPSVRTLSSQVRRGASAARRRGRGRGIRGRGGSSTRGGGRIGTSNSRSTRKRNRERSDDEEEQPVRARTRRRVTEVPSYVESDFESEEDEFINVDNDHNSDSEAGLRYMGSNNTNHSSAIAGPSTTTRRSTANATQSTAEPSEDRKGKRKLRSSTGDDESDMYASHSPETTHFDSKNFQAPGSSSSATSGRATRSTRSSQNEAHINPIPTRQHSVPPPSHSKTTTKKIIKQRDGPKELTEKEIKEHEPIPWITNIEKTLSKYLPQVGDYVAVLTEGHKQYLNSSEMTPFFDEKYGVMDQSEPVLFAKVVSISWFVGPPAYCRLKLSMMNLVNLVPAITGQADPIWAPLRADEFIEYTDEDGSPEFIVLWQRFMSSMSIFLTLTTGQKVDAIYDEGKYTGTIQSCNQRGVPWKRANLPSPWAFYHVIWDDKNSTPEDLSPWELVPAGEEFLARYNREPSLSAAQIKRARDVLEWLSNTEDFSLYVHQVDYYDYPPYLSMIAYPICLDMIKARLENKFYRSIEGIIDDVELIRKNATRYNSDTSPAYKNAIRLANFFKTRLLKTSMPLSLARGGIKKRAVVEESDDEYDNDNGQAYESEEEPALPKSAVREERAYLTDDDEEEDEFVDDDDDDDY